MKDQIGYLHFSIFLEGIQEHMIKRTASITQEKLATYFKQK
jgi:hypothetical protein